MNHHQLIIHFLIFNFRHLLPLGIKRAITENLISIMAYIISYLITLFFFPSASHSSANTISFALSKKPMSFFQLIPHLQCCKPINCCFIFFPHMGHTLLLLPVITNPQSAEYWLTAATFSQELLYPAATTDTVIRIRKISNDVFLLLRCRFEHCHQQSLILLFPLTNHFAVNHQCRHYIPARLNIALKFSCLKNKLFFFRELQRSWSNPAKNKHLGIP